MLYLLAALPLVQLAYAQTGCDAKTETCVDKSFKESVIVDFTQGQNALFEDLGAKTISYNSDGVNFIIDDTATAPTLASTEYLLYGNVKWTMKAAEGAGIVSSAILMSDFLDELDVEFVGYDSTHVQTNYFYQGNTTNYNRGTYNEVGDVFDFHTYEIDWTRDTATWLVDGVVIRVLSASDTVDGDSFPQTPMQIKMGSWSGGDASLNAPGTVEWSGGPTDYSKGPFTMTISRVEITPYTEADSFSFEGTSGKEDSIQVSGGSILNAASTYSAVSTSTTTVGYPTNSAGSRSFGAPVASNTPTGSSGALSASATPSSQVAGSTSDSGASASASPSSTPIASSTLISSQSPSVSSRSTGNSFIQASNSPSASQSSNLPPNSAAAVYINSSVVCLLGLAALMGLAL